MQDGVALGREVTNIIEIRDREANEVLRIAPDGRIFWRLREVTTDDEFRAAMLELKDALGKIWGGPG